MEVQSKCVCVEGCHSPNAPRVYPEWREGENNIDTFRSTGYMVVREMYTTGEVEQATREVSATIKKWYEKFYTNEKEEKNWEELVHRLLKLYQQHSVSVHAFILQAS